MSGKTTFLKQIALNVIMAQLGSFVACEYAKIPVYSNILSRMSMGDCMQTNASTFMMEMREVSFIFQTFSDESLILIDELGRGTSVVDGMALSFAITEELSQTRATVFHATHFHKVVDLLKDLTNIATLNLGVDVP